MKVYLDTIGCSSTKSEIETMARQSAQLGTRSWLQRTRRMWPWSIPARHLAGGGRVRRCHSTDARAGLAEIVATGCWATLQPEKAAALPNVLRVVKNAQKETLVPDLLNLPAESFDLEPIAASRCPGYASARAPSSRCRTAVTITAPSASPPFARGEGRSRLLRM